MNESSWITIAYHMFVENNMSYLTMWIFAIYAIARTWTTKKDRDQMDRIESKLNKL